jgi:indolepyruvate ferredoxin oxidoreductase alpha subunit
MKISLYSGFFRKNMDELLSTEVGIKRMLLGNEAIARGALEAGVEFVTTYPGTPSSEVGNLFSALGKKANVYFEFSANEKVAQEMAGAAADSGLKAFTFFKHVGFNVAADPFMVQLYQGVTGALVVFTADDPSCHSTQNEQDTRYYCRMANAPLFEPSSPQEAKDMIKEAFRVSESLELPVVFRSTTRISHSRADVEFGEYVPRTEIAQGEHIRDVSRFITVPPVARKRHIWLLERLSKAQEVSENSPFNYETVFGDGGSLGIITCSVTHGYVVDTLKQIGGDARVLKLGMSYPLPEKQIIKLLEQVDRILVVEELEPLVERDVKRLAFENDVKVEVLGKDSDHFPRYHEYNPDLVMGVLGKVLNEDVPKYAPKANYSDLKLPMRPPALCPGCGHRAAYYCAKVASKGDAFYGTDIGCYTLCIEAPFETADLLFCMGAAPSEAGGIWRATGRSSMGFIGDSTFFHSGLLEIISQVHNKNKCVIGVLDNHTTAMTGFQPHPGNSFDGMGEPAPALSIEKILESIELDYLAKTDPNDLEATTKAFKEALDCEGVGVVLCQRPCQLVEVGKMRKEGKKIIIYSVDTDVCKKCGKCVKQFACPASYIDEEGHAGINHLLCTGCGVCAAICPFDAIQEVAD